MRKRMSTSFKSSLHSFLPPFLHAFKYHKITTIKNPLLLLLLHKSFLKKLDLDFVILNYANVQLETDTSAGEEEWMYTNSMLLPAGNELTHVGNPQDPLTLLARPHNGPQSLETDRLRFLIVFPDLLVTIVEYLQYVFPFATHEVVVFCSIAIGAEKQNQNQISHFNPKSVKKEEKLSSKRI